MWPAARPCTFTLAVAATASHLKVTPRIRLLGRLGGERGGGEGEGGCKSKKVGEEFVDVYVTPSPPALPSTVMQQNLNGDEENWKMHPCKSQCHKIKEWGRGREGGEADRARITWALQHLAHATPPPPPHHKKNISKEFASARHSDD